MGRAVEVSVSSTLAAAASLVWARVTTMDGVNDELGPWVRMTHPTELSDLRDAPEDLLGHVTFHSWLLAGGLVPFDRHSLRLVELHDRGDEGGAFTEESTTWMQRRWRHQRTVQAVGPDRCTVTDQLVVESRVPFARPVVARIVPWLFDRRHRRLVQQFGAAL